MGMVIERVNGLRLRDLEIDWDTESPEPAWGSALVLRDVKGLVMESFRGKAGARDADVPAVRKEREEESGTD